jgi:hypothetical protein
MTRYVIASFFVVGCHSADQVDASADAAVEGSVDAAIDSEVDAMGVDGGLGRVFCETPDATGVCPPTEPADNELCGCTYLFCEWGTCPQSTVGWCNPYGKWVKQAFGPPSFDGGGSSCSQNDSNCSSAEGWCECKNGNWLCNDPDAGCPITRPAFGSACAQPTAKCAFPGAPCHDGVACTCGRWQPGPLTCPN